MPLCTIKYAIYFDLCSALKLVNNSFSGWVWVHAI